MEKDLDATPIGAGTSLPGAPVPQNQRTETRSCPWLRACQMDRWTCGWPLSQPTEVPLGCQPRRLQSIRGLLGPGARGVRLLCASGLRLMTSCSTSPASARSGTARQQSKSRVRTWLTCTVHSPGDRLASAWPGLKEKSRTPFALLTLPLCHERAHWPPA